MAPPDSADAAAEATLIRRVLFAAAPALPAPILLSSPGPLDHEAALLLAHGLRAAVLPWYSRLTPDRELLTVISGVFAAVLERIGQRLGSTDGQAALARFVGEELPALVAAHIEDVRACEAAAGTAAAQHASLATLYLSRAPHPALRVQPGTGEPLVDGAYLRALVEALLEALLPAEHWASECERFIVRDVVVGILRGSVLGRCTRPWFLVETAHKLLDARASKADEVAGTSKTATGFSVVAALHRLVSLALLCLSVLLPPLLRAYVELFTPAETQHRRRARRRRSNIGALTPGGPAWIAEADEPSMAPQPATRSAQSAPLLRLPPLLSLLSVMFELSNRALSRAALLLLHLAGDLGLAGLVETRIDSAMRHAVEPHRLAPVVRAVREAALPGGQLPPPAPPDPTPAQRRRDYARLLPRLCAAMPAPVRALLLGVQPATQEAALARAVGPFMGPPPAPHSPDEHCSGLAELANVRLYLAVLERLAVLIDPALEETGLTAAA